MLQRLEATEYITLLESMDQNVKGVLIRAEVARLGGLNTDNEGPVGSQYEHRLHELVHDTILTEQHARRPLRPVRFEDDVFVPSKGFRYYPKLDSRTQARIERRVAREGGMWGAIHELETLAVEYLLLPLFDLEIPLEAFARATVGSVRKDVAGRAAEAFTSESVAEHLRAKMELPDLHDYALVTLRRILYPVLSENVAFDVRYELGQIAEYDSLRVSPLFAGRFA